MDSMQLIFIFTSIVGLAIILGLAYVLLGGAGASRTSELRELMSPSRGTGDAARMGRPDRPDPMDVDVEDIKRKTAANLKGRTEDISAKLFKAGFFTADDRRWFLRFRIIMFAICLGVIPIVIWKFASGKPLLIVGAVVLGAIIGFTAPMSWLERQIKKREEEMMYFLPLVVEQVSIGVSSALDIGPCLSHITQMAGERDSHNCVTEMFVHVEKLIRSGLSLEDALIEVGEANGSIEVKHAFMFLAQCAKHGGEVSRQLQELADSVMVQRQVQIEGKIAALPVKATGPLGMVFAGFFLLLFAGLLVRLMTTFAT